MSPKPARAPLRQARGPEPDRQREGPHRQVHDRGGGAHAACSRKDRIVLEPTSGNTGIALAMICRIKGYRLKVVMPESVSAERTELLHGVRRRDRLLRRRPRHQRLDRGRERRSPPRTPTYFMPYQYGNETNPRAHYETTGPEILRDLPEIDVFVAGLGTGGTLTGTGRYLKEKKPGVEDRRRRAAPGRPGAGPAQPRRGLHPAGPRRVGARRQDRGRLAHVVRVVERADAEGGHLRRHLRRRRRASGPARRRAPGRRQHRLPASPTAAGSTSARISGPRTTKTCPSDIEDKIWW